MKTWIKTHPLLSLLLVALMASLCIAAAPASRDYVLSTLTVWPASSENGTNSVIFKNKAGTNWWSLDPTNGLVKLRQSGTNYTAVAWTNIVVTNAGHLKLIFKNGLLVDVGTGP